MTIDKVSESRYNALINLNPPSGTPIIGSPPVAGGNGNEVNFW